MRLIISLLLVMFLSASAFCADTAELLADSFTIRYEEGLKGAAGEIARMVPLLKGRLQVQTGLSFDFPFEIIIYKNRNDFTRIARSDMVAAFAVPDQNLIVIDLSQMRVHPLNLELITLHEMCHLLLRRHIEERILPRWFDEGVAQWVSGGMNEIINPQEGNVLRKAVISQGLLSFSEMAHDFPRDRNGFALAYEQSSSMIEFIESAYGQGSVKGILMRLAQGEDFSDAVRDALSTGFDEVIQNWTRKIQIRYTWLAYLSENIYWILFIAAAVITVCGFIRLRKKIKEYPDDEETEELR